MTVEAAGKDLRQVDATAFRKGEGASTVRGVVTGRRVIQLECHTRGRARCFGVTMGEQQSILSEGDELLVVRSLVFLENL